MKSLNVLSLVLGVVIGIALNSALVALDTASKLETKVVTLNIGDCGRALGQEHVLKVTALSNDGSYVETSMKYGSENQFTSLDTFPQGQLLKVDCAK